ncbi:MAG: hypothetical protein IT445_10990 [Phycisphaeraceae bacterium]|nr:hypothetical protein [Phycisphaeraceae bacterium]
MKVEQTSESEANLSRKRNPKQETDFSSSSALRALSYLTHMLPALLEDVLFWVLLLLTIVFAMR